MFVIEFCDQDLEKTSEDQAVGPYCWTRREAEVKDVVMYGVGEFFVFEYKDMFIIIEGVELRVKLRTF